MNKKELGLTFERFWQELVEAERFGNIAVRVTVESAFEKWNDDWAKLALLSDSLICRATFLIARNDRELTGVYLLLIKQIWDWAEENLSGRAFHDFCIYSPRNHAYMLYSDDTPEILDFLLEFG